MFRRQMARPPAERVVVVAGRESDGEGEQEDEENEEGRT